MHNLPFYLLKRLQKWNYPDLKPIQALGYLEIFRQLRLTEPSLGFRALFDLYCWCQSVEPPLAHTLCQQLIHNYKQLPPHYPELTQTQIQTYLGAAFEQAQLAQQAGEVPVGAIIVWQEQIIGRGYNHTRGRCSIIAHAEIEAITEAQIFLNNFRLHECDLYVTLEPCLMCCGAIMHSRLRRLIFAAAEPKTGACSSQYQVFNNRATNHHCQVIGPVVPQMATLLQNFFRQQN